MIRNLLSTFTLLLIGGTIIAQPANDNCVDAEEIPFATDEASAVRVIGDTRGGTGDDSVPDVCSGSYYRDDVWYYFVIPGDVPMDGIEVKTYFGDEADDVPSVGMAIYESCDSSAAPLACFSSQVDELDDNLVISAACINANDTFYVRVWSGGDSTAFSGTFRVAAFGSVELNVVLWEETFGDSLDGWTTFGTCADPDKNENATFKYFADGLVNMGAFSSGSSGIQSRTVCDGAVGVDGDFDDNNGVGDFGTGPCPAIGTYFLESPVIYVGDWNVSGVSLSWTQGLRPFFDTQHNVGYRTRSAGGDWTEWTNIVVNEEFELNPSFFTASDEQRVFLGGALEEDSLQIRFAYVSNYYWWAIDDVRLVEQEAHNMRAMTNWYAVAPAIRIPKGQRYPQWIPLVDIFNAGAETQTGVKVEYTLQNADGDLIYLDSAEYGPLTGDSLAENVNFPSAVETPDVLGTLVGRYVVTSDSAMLDTDFDFSDNVIDHVYAVTDSTYSLDLNGPTTALRVIPSFYNQGALPSFVWGIYMHLSNGSEVTVGNATWGVNDAEQTPGQLMSIVLYEWINTNDNDLAEESERSIVGFGTYTIIGDEGTSAIFNTPLDNFDDPGQPIVLKDNTDYLLMIEYDAATDADFFILANDEVDYGAVALSAAQAPDANELPLPPVYAGVVGASPDGFIQGIDYGVGPSAPVWFGYDNVPFLRLTLNPDTSTAVVDLLPEENKISVFPSPADVQFTVDMDFPTAISDVRMQLIDVTGRMVMSQEFASVSQERIIVNSTDYAEGAYLLQVQTPEGSRSARVVVHH